MQRPAEEGPDQHDAAQYRDAAGVRGSPRRSDDVGGDQELQTEQDQAAEPFPERARYGSPIRRLGIGTTLAAEIGAPMAITATPITSIDLPVVSMTSKKLTAELVGNARRR